GLKENVIVGRHLRGERKNPPRHPRSGSWCGPRRGGAPSSAKGILRRCSGSFGYISLGVPFPSISKRTNMMRRLVAPLVCLGIVVAGAAIGETYDVRDAIKRLKSRNVEDRILGAKLLRVKEEPEAVEALAEALQDKDARVRREAASSLWGTGEKAKAAEPALRKALNDPDPAVVAHAAGALEMMDVDAKELAPARRRALSAVDP